MISLREEFFIEGCLSLYFGGAGTGFRGFGVEMYRNQSKLDIERNDAHHHKLVNDAKSWLEGFKPEPGIVYDVALAAGQIELFNETLEAAGFKQVVTSINPNTMNKIAFYIREPR